MADLRSSWTFFGLAEDPGNEEGLTVIDKAPIFLELGSVDPVEKACRDELATVMHNSTNARVEAPLAKHLQKLRAQFEADNKNAEALENVNKTIAALGGKWADGADNKAAAKPEVEDKPTEKLTWKEAQEKKRGGGAASAAKPKPGGGFVQAGPGGRREAEPKSTVRVSNLTDAISTTEIHRLFGPENNLGRIQRLYIAKDKDGNRKGFCYITYATAKLAEQAIAKLHRCAFKNVILFVDYGTARS